MPLIDSLMQTAAYLIKTSVYVIAALSLGLVSLLYLTQNRIIYPSHFPEKSRTDVASPETFNLPFTAVTLETSDGFKLHCYLIPSTTNSDYSMERTLPTTILLLHANAGNMGHRLPIARRLHQSLNTNVFMLSYRGYGLSDGVASEVGIKVDVQVG